MNSITIREPRLEDRESFLDAMRQSQKLHYPWVNPPSSIKEFDEYIQDAHKPNRKSFFVCTSSNAIAGVFNISEIVRGCFQSAYLGYYVVAAYAGQGLMSSGLKLVLHHAFGELKLHRLEANIQQANLPSIQLVKSNGFRYEGFSPRYLKVNEVWCGHERWAITVEDYSNDLQSPILHQ